MKKLVITLCAVCAVTAGCLLYAAQTPAPVPAAAAENFSLPALDGKEFKLEDSLGKGYVVLNFWARWCASCEEEVPQLAALMKSTGTAKVLFVGVNVGDTETKAAKFVSKFKYPYLVVMDKDKAVAKKYGVLGLPVTLIIDPTRKIVFRGTRPPKTFDFAK